MKVPLTLQDCNVATTAINTPEEIKINIKDSKKTVNKFHNI